MSQLFIQSENVENKINRTTGVKQTIEHSQRISDSREKIK